MSELMERVLMAASWAPSPENNQPWQFKVNNQTVYLRYAQERALSTDPEHLYNWLSLGAALENMRLAGENEGFSAQIRLANSEDDPLLAAEVTFIPFSQNQHLLAPQSESLYPLIFTRFTDRSDLRDSKPLPKEYYGKIEELALQNSVKVHFVDSSSHLKVWGKTIGYLNKLRFFSKIFHQEISRSLCFSKQDYESRQDGIWVKSLHLPSGAGLLFQLLVSWRWTKILRLFGIGLIIQRTVTRQIIKSSALLVITSKDDTKPSLLKAGQLMQLAWLHATKHEISVHPLGEIPIFLRLKEDLYRSSRLLSKRGLINHRISEALKTLGPTDGPPIMVLRMGWGLRKGLSRQRYPLKKLIT